jgi:hypothetical protein
MAKLILSGLDDLDDDLPKQITIETKAPAGKFTVEREEIDTSHFGIPVARSLFIQPTKCLSCGEEHYEHQGICLQLKYTDGSRVWRQMELLEAAAYKDLPRDVQYRHPITLDFCHSCYLLDSLVGKFFNQEPNLDVSDLEEPCTPIGKEECHSSRPEPWNRLLPVPVPGETVTFPG